MTVAVADLPYRAYPGASWPNEPVEADFLSSHATLEDAQAACDGYTRGGFDSFIINRERGIYWRRPVGKDDWMAKVLPEHGGEMP